MGAFSHIIKGVDLGGWLSQCDYSTERLDHFIEESDIERIAGWGLDHVRIPFDYNIVQAADGSPIEAGYARIDAALGWCKKNGLAVVLDLHKTRGFSFDDGEGEGGFFDSADMQELFYTLWEEVARRYGSRTEDIIFELLNEITDKGYIDEWNRISTEAVRRIRAIAPDIEILIGSYKNNAVEAVPALAAPYDKNVIYNFHCYDPIEFTHQGAYWYEPCNNDKRPTFAESGASEAYFEKLFAPALEKAKKEGTRLYCGEYGVIDRAATEEALKWYRAIHVVFEKYDIPRAAWNYKEMDFGISDARMDGVRDELIKLL